MDALRGMAALVTGGARRLGREVALALADEGVDVVVHYRSSEGAARELCDELAARGVRSFAVQADFAEPGSFDAVVESAIERAGRLDALVNNASIFPSSKLASMELDGLLHNVQVNAWAPFALSRAFARAAARGSIVNFLDTRVVGYDWNHAEYILSKHVLAQLTRMTAMAYAPDVRVNAVAPGLILPPEGKDESHLERLAGSLPLRRHGSPRDVVRAVLFLLLSDFVTGQVIFVDGGRHLRAGDDG